MNYPYNPYYAGQPMPTMPQMQQQGMPVQTIQQVQKTAQFYSVENAEELDGIKPTLNVLYVGMNKKKKEIYVKQLTNDGLISVETYEQQKETLLNYAQSKGYDRNMVAQFLNSHP